MGPDSSPFGHLPWISAKQGPGAANAKICHKGSQSSYQVLSPAALLPAGGIPLSVSCNTAPAAFQCRGPLLHQVLWDLVLICLVTSDPSDQTPI